MPLKSLITEWRQRLIAKSTNVMYMWTQMCFFYWSNLHSLFCYLNFPIYEHSTRSKCAVTLITTRDRTQIKMKTPRESSICTFYSSISQQFISEITVNISFHKRRTARKDRTVCVVLICFIKVHTKGTNSGTTQKNNIPSSL